MYPDAPLYTSVYNPKTAPWADIFDVRTSFLQAIPYIRTHHEQFAWLMPLAFESFSFDEYDLVISVTSAEAKGVITKPHTRHICYCLTPTRYLWSHYTQYLSNRVYRVLAYPLISYLRKWDTIAAQRPDSFIAISSAVRDRIKIYYQRDAELIHPPVTASTSTQQPSDTAYASMLKSCGFFLVVSRLVKYKQVDLAIHACNELKIPLVVVGTGHEERFLKSIAGNTIFFEKNLTEEELSWYYHYCRALIMPQEEDFGIVAVEAQFAGKPVIAFRKGGSCDIIRDGKSGAFFCEQTIGALKTELQSFKTTAYTKLNCQSQARRFAVSQFRRKLRAFIAS
jgi:glycosyltransferase involved in cell wall biosynthesis